MSSVKVVDLNEEAREIPPIEEAPEEEQVADFLNSNKVGVEQPDIVNEVVEETAQGSLNIKDVETNEEHKEEANEEVKPTPKVKPKAKPKAGDIVQCPDCSRSMTYKNLRYSHKCSPEPPPVKKQANPKGKAKAKPKPAKPPPEVYYSESEEEEDIQPLIKKKIKKPETVNPATTLAQQYQLLQQQMMQQKQERYNKICQGMFAPRMKKQ